MRGDRKPWGIGRRLLTGLGAVVLLLAPLPLVVAPSASAATVTVNVPCADGSSAVNINAGDTISLGGGILPPCGVASSSSSGSVSKIDDYTFAVNSPAEGTINILSDTGSHTYVIHVNYAGAAHPPYPANVGPRAQGPACPWGGHLNESGDLCVGIDLPPAASPTPVPSPTITVDPNTPEPTDPPTAASSAPKPKQRLTPQDVSIVQGPTANTVKVVDTAGNPLQLLSLTGDTRGVTVVSAGTDFAANAANWVELGYGDLCWTYSGYTDATGMILPKPTPPFRTIDATWRLSTAVLSTATGNVIFRTANPGDIVEAGGREIRSVTICAAIVQDESEMRSVAQKKKPGQGGSCTNGSWCQKNGNNCQSKQNGGHPYQYWNGGCWVPSQLPFVQACRPEPDGTYTRVSIRIDSLDGFAPANPTAIIESKSDVSGQRGYPGQNWFGSNINTLRNNNCQLPVQPVAQTGSATYPAYCMNPNSVNAQTITGGTRFVTVTATGWGDQAAANAEALRQANAQAQREVANGALPSGATAGVCPSYSKTTTNFITQDYCEAGANIAQTFTGTGTVTSSVSQADADVLARTAADQDAIARQSQWEATHPQATRGTCRVYTGIFDPFAVPLTYCQNGVDGTTSLTVNATGTSTVSQVDANSNQIADALAKSAQAKKEWLAQNGATEGTCKRHTVDAPYSGTVTYCLNDVTNTRTYSGVATGVSTVGWFEAAAEATRLANEAAAREQSTIPTGAAPGKCAPTYSATRTVLEPVTYCQAGQTVVDFAQGQSTVQSKVDQADADSKAEADAMAKAKQNATNFALPSGATAGGCTTYSATATASGIAPFCVNGVITPFPYSQTATATSTQSSNDAFTKALQQATDLANQDLAGRVPAGANPGQCITYRTSVTVGGTQQYCKAGVTSVYPYSGTGTGVSTISVDDARAKATVAADLEADRARTAGLPGGAIAGRCPPPVVVTLPPTPIPVTGTTTTSIPTTNPGVLTGCGATSKVINPMPPLVPIPVQGGCVPSVVTPPTVDRQRPPASKKPIVGVPSATPTGSATPSAGSSTPAASSTPTGSATPSAGSSTPAASPGPAASSGPGTTPSPSTAPSTDGTVTLVVSNGPSIVSKTVTVTDLQKVAEGGTLTDNSTNEPGAGSGSSEGGLVDTGSHTGAWLTGALVLLGLALLSLPHVARRRS